MFIQLPEWLKWFLKGVFYALEMANDLSWSALERGEHNREYSPWPLMQWYLCSNFALLPVFWFLSGSKYFSAVENVISLKMTFPTCVCDNIRVPPAWNSTLQEKKKKKRPEVFLRLNMKRCKETVYMLICFIIILNVICRNSIFQCKFLLVLPLRRYL